jgi:predicted amidohydrolase YtcJ
MVRAGSVVRAGISLSFHSGLPMGPSDPLHLAWAGVNRITTSGRVAGPAQRITVDQALCAITIDAAFSWRKEAQIGSLRRQHAAIAPDAAGGPLQALAERLRD